MGAREIYAAMQEVFPGEKNAPIGRHTGAGNGVISKLGNGQGIGLIQAQWLADHDPKYTPLLAEAQAATQAHRKSRSTTMNRVKAQKAPPVSEGKMRGVKLCELPPHLQAFCGYRS